MYLLAENGGIQAVVNAIANLVNFFKVLWAFITNIIVSLITALSYLVAIIPKVAIYIATLPGWLIAFAEITLGISVAYFIIGRNGGKTE